MIVYHCTRKKLLDSILDEGVKPPSYWGSLQTALSYSRAWKDYVILSTDTDNYNFSVNMDNAILQKKNNYIKDLPDPHELEIGLVFFKGVICHERIFEFKIIEDKHTNCILD